MDNTIDVGKINSLLDQYIDKSKAQPLAGSQTSADKKGMSLSPQGLPSVNATGSGYDKLVKLPSIDSAIQAIQNQQEKSIAEYNLRSNLDIEAAEREVATYDEKIALLKMDYARNGVGLITDGTNPQAAAFAEEIKQLESRRNAIQQAINNARSTQTLNRYNSMADDPYFAQYALRGEGMGYSPIKTLPSVGSGKADDRYDIQNRLAFAYDPEVADGNAFWLGEDEEERYEAYKEMTTDEQALYHYLIGKYGTKEGDKYLDALYENLNIRAGQKAAENMTDLQKAAYSVGSGLDQFATGVRQAFSPEALPTTRTAATSAAIYEGIESPFWRGAYQVGSSVGNMLPAVGLSIATGGLGAPAAVSGAIGSAAMGLSSGGNAYGEALKEGYTPEQARTYGILTGASEGALQYILGGIGTLGGQATNNVVQRLVGNVKNAALKTAAKIGIQAVGEGAEEYLQSILTPVIRNLALDENNEIKLVSEEALEDAMIGAIVSVLLGTGGNVSDAVGTKRLGDAVQASGEYNTLLENALTLDLSTEAFNRAMQMKTGRVQPTSTNVGELARAYQEAGGDLSFLQNALLDNIEQNAQVRQGQDITPLRVGRATTIKRPYAGVTPENANGIQGNVVEITPESLSIATEQIAQVLPSPSETQTEPLGLGELPSADKEFEAAQDMVVKIRDKGVNATKTLSRNLDAAAGGDPDVRSILYNAIEKPANEAAQRYTRETVSRLNGLFGTLQKIGIDTRKGSKDSQAIQRYGEKQYQDKDGNIIPYTLDDLQEQFSDRWQKIVQAEQEFRRIYDEYVDRINAMLETVYPKAVEVVQKRKANLEKQIAAAENKRKSAVNRLETQDEIINDIRSKMEGKKKKDTKTYERLHNQLAKALSTKRDISNEITELSNRENGLRDTYKKVITGIENGEAYRNKRLIKREDYFHHFQEMAEGISALVNIFEAENNISPMLAGISADTKPKSKWEGFMQRREGGAYSEDAIGGMVKYIQAAEHKIAFDPLIADIRDKIEILRDAATAANNKRANALIQQLTDWINNISGKSSGIDRAIGDWFGGRGRTALKAINWLNGRVKSNTLLGSFRNALTQFFNLPNLALYSSNPAEWGRGLRSAVKSMVGKNRDVYQDIRAQSTFMTQRYDIDKAKRQFEKQLSKKPKQAALAMMEFGDKVVANYVWWTMYEQYVNNGGNVKNAARPYENAIDYADDVTRRIVAGRDVGEMPNMLNSKIVNLVAPFQVEIQNQFDLLKDRIGKQKAAGIAGFLVATYVMNTVAEAVTGNRPGGYDFIQAVYDIVKGEIEAANDDDEEKRTFGQILTDTAWRLVGEFFGSVPYASQITSAAFNEEAAEQLFGEQDPTRYGTQNVGLGAIGDLVALGDDLISGERVEWDDVLSTALPLVMPWGGGQLARSITGARTAIEGGSYSYDSEGNPRLQFEAGQDAYDTAQGIMFGKWSTPNAREYVDSGFNMLSADDTAAYKKAIEAGVDGIEFLTLRAEIKALEPIRDETGDTVQTTKEQARRLIMESDYTPEQKTVIDQYLLRDTTEDEQGTEVPKTADYSSEMMFELSLLDKETYAEAKEAVGMGVSPETYFDYINIYDQLKGDEERNIKFETALHDDNTLTPDQKAFIETSIKSGWVMTRNDGGTPADYSSDAAFALSQAGTSAVEGAEEALANGISNDQYLEYYNARKDINGKNSDNVTESGLEKTRVLELLENLGLDARGKLYLLSKNGYVDYKDVSMAERNARITAEQYIDYIYRTNGLKADKDEDGKSISGSLKKKIIAEIENMNLTPEQERYMIETVAGYKYK